MKRVIALIICFAAVLGTASCIETKPHNESFSEIAGSYEVDGCEYGVRAEINLDITENGTITVTVNGGEKLLTGTVLRNESVYTVLTDESGEAAANFSVNNFSLIFSDGFPSGELKLSSQNGTVTACKKDFSDMLGIYFGDNCRLSLFSGRRYAFGTELSEEKGFFEIENGRITLTASSGNVRHGSAVPGKIIIDDSADVKTELKLSAGAGLAGNYSGVAAFTVGAVSVPCAVYLTVTESGGYAMKAVDCSGEPLVDSNGTVSMSDGSVCFTDISGESITAAVADGGLSVTGVTIKYDGKSTVLPLFSSEIQGTFEADGAKLRVFGSVFELKTGETIITGTVKTAGFPCGKLLLIPIEKNGAAYPSEMPETISLTVFDGLSGELPGMGVVRLVKTSAFTVGDIIG